MKKYFEEIGIDLQKIFKDIKKTLSEQLNEKSDNFRQNYDEEITPEEKKSFQDFADSLSPDKKDKLMEKYNSLDKSGKKFLSGMIKRGKELGIDKNVIFDKVDKLDVNKELEKQRQQEKERIKEKERERQKKLEKARREKLEKKKKLDKKKGKKKDLKKEKESNERKKSSKIGLDGEEFMSSLSAAVGKKSREASRDDEKLEKSLDSKNKERISLEADLNLIKKMLKEVIEQGKNSDKKQSFVDLEKSRGKKSFVKIDEEVKANKDKQLGFIRSKS